jgi:thiamine-phosphate pyrophosphorylase
MAVVASAREGLRAADRATVIQLRSPGMTARELEANAIELVGASPVPVLISSRCDIVLASRAAGVNLPERDIAVQDARALLGQRLIGRSVHSLQSALDAQQGGADFVIFGPVWSSESHADTPPQGLDALTAVTHALRIPVLAIGGVTVDRIAACEAAGAAGYAAIRLFQ